MHFYTIHLGLAIELYHEYGSRTLIETLFSHGHARNFVRVDGIFSKDVPRETWIKFMLNIKTFYVASYNA
jgi:hypothetical protein